VPWPAFTEVRIPDVAHGLGCPARRVATYDDLVATLDELLPSLAERTGPLVLDIEVAPDETYGQSAPHWFSSPSSVTRCGFSVSIAGSSRWTNPPSRRQLDLGNSSVKGPAICRVPDPTHA
jgi:hypothetical protein